MRVFYPSEGKKWVGAFRGVTIVRDDGGRGDGSLGVLGRGHDLWLGSLRGGGSNDPWLGP